MKRVALLLILALPLVPAPSRYDSLPTERKLDLIEQGRVPPGTQLVFAERELNTFVVRKAKELIPTGLREPKVSLSDGAVIGTAYVDFVKMRHAQGEDLNWLVAKLLTGEHPVFVKGRVTSANGSARVDLENVDIGGNSIKGRALDLMVRAFVSPLYPQAKVGTDFELGYNVDRIEVKQGLARVVMSRTQGSF
jgi:hypothetical protein